MSRRTDTDASVREEEPTRTETAPQRAPWLIEGTRTLGAEPDQRRPAVRSSILPSAAGSVIRWGVPLLGLLVILFFSYQNLIHERYDSENGITGELTAGHSAGQSFISRYPDLAGIEVHVSTFSTGNGHAPASLVLHLRKSPGTHVDIATSRINAEDIAGGNGWYRFDFPPVHDSGDRPLYFEIESPDATAGHAVTLLWWQAVTDSNPYLKGAAFRNGRREHADLAFGLVYSATPLAVSSRVATDIFNQNPFGSAFVVAGLALLVATWLVWLRTMRKAHAAEVVRKISLPLVLCTGLVVGAANMVITPPWQGPDEHAHFAYAAMLQKYGLDPSKAVAAGSARGSQEVAFAETISNSMDHFNFTRLVPNPNPGTQSNAQVSVWWEMHQPPPYYWLAAAVLTLGRVAGLAPDPFTAPADALYWVRAVSVALSLFVVALAWLAGVILGGQRRPWLVLLIPLAVALLPMHAYMAGVAENDISAELVCAALFVALAALFRWPQGRRGVLLAVLALALGFATRYTKTTAYAMLPVLAICLGFWLVRYVLRPLARRFRNRASGFSAPGPKARVIIGLGVLAAICALAFAFVRPDSSAAEWLTSYQAPSRAPRVATGSAHNGSYVLELRPTGDAGAVASQTLIPNLFHPSFKITVSGWARTASGSMGNAQALLVVTSNGKNLGQGGVELPSSGEWTPVSVTATVPESYQSVLVQVAAYGAGSAVQFDDMHLSVDGPPLPRYDWLSGYHLANPSFEQQGTALLPAVSRLLPLRARQVVDVLLNSQTFQKKGLWLAFAVEEYRSFWGNFGWLALPLPPVAYWLIGGLVALAFVGLVVRAISRLDRYDWKDRLALACVAGMTIGVVGVFAEQTVLLAVIGNYSFPQGRYFFVAIIPVVWLISSGLQGLFTRAARAGKRLTAGRSVVVGERGQTRYLIPWGPWLLCTGFVLFFAYCLLDLIVPYFYN